MSRESQETSAFGADGTPVQRLSQGAVLGRRYVLQQEIGRGGMGVVWRAMDLELRREVAVKVLPEAASSPDARERLLREARAAAALNHPHIVSVHDVGEDQGMPFFVMELVAGSHLGEARPADLREIVRIAVQICEALEHAHEHRIVHRDLKPENVLLAGEREPRMVKLADLGLAMPGQASRITQAGAIVGTAAYMAPEQAMGEPVDGRTDLYSLGVLLYELTTGRLPFTGDHPLAIISQHVNAPIVPPRARRSDLPRGLDAAIVKLLAKNPAHRFGTAQEAKEALARSLDADAAGTAADGAEGGPAAVALLEALARGRMVGRTEELAEARELWRRAREGRGHGVLISGEPGSGKTRFAREVMIQAALDGAAVLTGACYEYEAATPYLPFAEAFRRWVRDQKDPARVREVFGEGGSLLVKLAPEIEAHCGPAPDRPDLAPHEERLLFFDAVAQALRAFARRSGGVLFYVDDLHWADSGTLWLMAHLLRNLRDERVLLMASYRETELDRAHPLAKALVDWNRERLTTRIPLKRLAPRETAEQLSALLGEEVGGEFASAVHRETEGNPFFVEEVLKALIEQGSVRRESGQWKQCEIGELQIPQSVKAAIGHRLDRVSPACIEVLRAAAVLGKSFGVGDLEAAAGETGEDALLDALDEAVTAQLLVSGRDDTFAFTHDKIREVLYEELNPIRRRRLHRRTAEGLERHHRSGAIPVEKLAHHFIEAGEHERGLAYAKEAAALAERLFAYEEAIGAYGRAIECAETLGLDEERRSIEEGIGRMWLLSGSTIPACEHFERALALSTDRQERARLHGLAASSLVTNGDPRGLEHVREALAVLDPGTHPVETASALATEARFHHLAGRHRKAVELLERAAALIAPSEAKPALSALEETAIPMIFVFLAGAHQHLGLFADADRWARRAIQFGTAHNVLFAQATGYEFLGEDASSAGFWKEGLQYAETEREIAGRLHSRERRAWSFLVTGIGNMCLGRAREAEEACREGLDLARALGERRLEILLMGEYAILQADLGRREEALTDALGNLERAEAIDQLYMRTEARRSLAHVRFRRGELDESLRLCGEVLDLTRGKEAVVSRLWMGPLHVEALLAAGRHADARTVLADYSAITSVCQSPHFAREAARLQKVLAQG